MKIVITTPEKEVADQLHPELLPVIGHALVNASVTEKAMDPEDQGKTWELRLYPMTEEEADGWNRDDTTQKVANGTHNGPGSYKNGPTRGAIFTFGPERVMVELIDPWGERSIHYRRHDGQMDIWM